MSENFSLDSSEINYHNKKCKLYGGYKERLAF